MASPDLEFCWKEPRRPRTALITARQTPTSAPPGAMSHTSSSKRVCRREPAPAPLAGAGPAPAPAPVRPPVRAPVFKKFPPPTLPPPPTPLLDLLEWFPDLFASELLARLPPAARASLARAGRVWRDAVFPKDIFPNGLSRAKKPGRSAVRVFKLRRFLGSFERLAWAKANGCPWDTRTTALAAGAWGGNLEVLKWARDHHCPWDKMTCANAASFGHLEVLKWAQEHGCPWDGEDDDEEEQEDAEEGYDEDTNNCCALAARGGHLEVLKWLREHHCPWDEITCSEAADKGELKTLKWARENGCLWDETTCTNAASNGHLKVLRYAHRNNCPW